MEFIFAICSTLRSKPIGFICGLDVRTIIKLMFSACQIDLIVGLLRASKVYLQLIPLLCGSTECSCHFKGSTRQGIKILRPRIESLLFVLPPAGAWEVDQHHTTLHSRITILDSSHWMALVYLPICLDHDRLLCAIIQAGSMLIKEWWPQIWLWVSTSSMSTLIVQQLGKPWN